MRDTLTAPVEWVRKHVILNSLNRLCWGVQHVETAVVGAAEAIHPAVRLLNGPIGLVDRALCRSIDYVEQQVPAIYLPPEMMLAHTKEYVADRLMRPVLRRTESVKKMRDAVLDSPVSVYAAHRLDGAIDAADKYVERFLPQRADDEDGAAAAAESVDTVDGALATDAAAAAGDNSRPVHTLNKGRRFSTKLKRRLTQRTISEARALQHGSREAVHIVRYAVELMVRDPRQACRRAAELWTYLSADEPDNQARPQTLEQLIGLLVRETARKVVHLTNYLARTTSEIPRNFVQSSTAAAHYYVDTTMAQIRLDTLTSAPRQLNKSLQNRYAQFESYSAVELERLAYYIAGRQWPPSAILTPPQAAGNAAGNLVANGN